MNHPELERADRFGRDQARRSYAAITQTIRDLEKRNPGCTRHVAAWTVTELPDGSLIGVPKSPVQKRLTVAEMTRRTQARMR